MTTTRGKTLAPGQSIEVQGTAKDPYVVKNDNGAFSCTCAAWTFGGDAKGKRDCKHIKAVRANAPPTPAPTPKPPEVAGADGINPRTRSKLERERAKAAGLKKVKEDHGAKLSPKANALIDEAVADVEANVAKLEPPTPPRIEDAPAEHVVWWCPRCNVAPGLAELAMPIPPMHNICFATCHRKTIMQSTGGAPRPPTLDKARDVVARAVAEPPKARPPTMG